MNNKPPISFWIIAVIALLWNIMGVFQFYMATYELESVRENMSAEEFAIMESVPTWSAVLFGIAVFSGVLGCILLLARKKWATYLFGISLITVLIIEFYWLLATDIIEVSGAVSMVMPLLVIAFAIFLYFYSKGATKKGWLS